MQVAYLIAAHHQPNQLAKLIKMLDGHHCVFFIHIDAKVDATPFQEAVGRNDRAIFIEQRCEVNWAGFSVVRAMLSLLSVAFAWDRSFDRFCLLSGSDFPITSNRRILSEFDSDREFIRIDRRLDPREDEGHHRKVSHYWFADGPEAHLKGVSGQMKRKPYDHLALYHGSQWWALTRDCVEYALDFVSAHEEYCSYLQHAFAPDEICFHSILKQSPFASRISHDFEKAPSQPEYFLSNEHGCHYLDWNSPSPTLPKILGLEDFDKLVSSKCLFARKFDEQQSRDLIARLENMLSV